jgi:hypothetical protein
VPTTRTGDDRRQEAPVFNLFRRRPARTPAPTARLSLESLDRRDVPSAVTGDDLRCGNEVEVRFPNRGGCWPGPVPVLTTGIIIIGGADEQTQKVASVGTVGSGDEGAIIIVNNLPADALSQKAASTQKV